jgi:hypothetical protein
MDRREIFQPGLRDIKEIFLHCTARLLRKSEGEKKRRAAPVGMTVLGGLTEIVAKVNQKTT